MLRILLLVGSLFLVTACMTTKPLYNAQDASFAAPLTNEQAKQAIIDALTYKRWQVVSQSDQEIVADIYVRSHYARIAIPYSKTGFSIRYQDSNNLDYDDEDVAIHRNYNKWIQLLETEIKAYAAKAG